MGDNRDDLLDSRTQLKVRDAAARCASATARLVRAGRKPGRPGRVHFLLPRPVGRRMAGAMEMAVGHPLQPLLPGDPLKLGDVTLAALAGKLGYAFARPGAAVEALTHRSALDRQPALKAAFPNGNERLEFLGDRVLSLVVADLLLRRFPAGARGRAGAPPCALVAPGRWPRSPRRSGWRDHRARRSRDGGRPATPAILADALEAVIGAIFLDGGIEVAARLDRAAVGDRLQRSRAARPQDRAAGMGAGRGLAAAGLCEVGREGPEHAPVFRGRCRGRGTCRPAQGRGGSKREAERCRGGAAPRPAGQA